MVFIVIVHPLLKIFALRPTALRFHHTTVGRGAQFKINTTAKSKFRKLFTSFGAAGGRGMLFSVCQKTINPFISPPQPALRLPGVPVRKRCLRASSRVNAALEIRSGGMYAARTRPRWPLPLSFSGRCRRQQENDVPHENEYFIFMTACRLFRHAGYFIGFMIK
jgi:hypothetical protein